MHNKRRAAHYQNSKIYLVCLHCSRRRVEKNLRKVCLKKIVALPLIIYRYQQLKNEIKDQARAQHFTAALWY